MKSTSFSDVQEGGDFFSAFRAITYGETTLKEKKLPAAKPAPEIPQRIGSSAPVASPSGSGGFSGPLTEAAYAQRAYWPVRTSITPDGLFSLSWAPLKSIRMLDAAAAEVVMNFKEPPA